MKAKQTDFQQVARRAGSQCKLFLLIGPDEAGAAEAAKQLAASFDQPIERVDLSGADLKRDPVRLADEAQSVSLFGDRRYVLVRSAGEEATAAVENLLDQQVDGCPVIILVPGATDKSKLAKLLAPRQDAIMAVFWPPDLAAMAGQVRQLADANGLRMDSAVAERIAKATGMDRRLAEAEVVKLALYLDAGPQHPQTADHAALDAIGAATDDDAIQPIVNAVLGGDTARLAGEMQRMAETGLNPVAVALAFERRVAQLAAFDARAGAAGNLSGFLDNEVTARRLFWKDKPAISNQLRRWRGERLARLSTRLIALHQQLLANSQAAELLLAGELAAIARAASKAGR